MSSSTSDSSVVTNKPSDLVTVSNVAEIFNAAGFAFKKLGELVQQLDNGSVNDNSTVNGGAENGNEPVSHWDASDVEQFQLIITNFSEEIGKLASNLKNKMSARLQNEHTEKEMNKLTSSERDAIKTEP
ncbi:hypothetical protein RDWZM_005007 [Blomia tropicalis]|uniref:Uncharacterized protein n=1 Tax=Blomia tropicalis TaxID=40697 RepID=A0A9Q0M4Y4_BLOTA|nr:hypothetical protein BLOT_005394 [Blomia tropicalis]KAJ6219195.1 hypothetical protein RDWZM_005007 [Blomia tropicalis]